MTKYTVLPPLKIHNLMWCDFEIWDFEIERFSADYTTLNVVFVEEEDKQMYPPVWSSQLWPDWLLKLHFCILQLQQRSQKKHYVTAYLRLEISFHCERNHLYIVLLSVSGLIVMHMFHTVVCLARDSYCGFHPSVHNNLWITRILGFSWWGNIFLFSQIFNCITNLVVR